jgi:hypothetical protein
MSESINVNEIPKHIMALDSISRRIEHPFKTSKVMKIDKAKVEIILNDLTFQRLIIVEQKNDLFAKKMQAPIIDAASRLLHSKRRELEDKARVLEAMARNSHRKGTESFINDNSNGSSDAGAAADTKGCDLGGDLTFDS